MFSLRFAPLVAALLLTSLQQSASAQYERESTMQSCAPGYRVWGKMCIPKDPSRQREYKRPSTDNGMCAPGYRTWGDACIPKG